MRQIPDVVDDAIVYWIFSIANSANAAGHALTTRQARAPGALRLTPAGGHRAAVAVTQGGHVRYTLKTPYRDGTTHVIFEPEDFIARLAALVPKPRAHLTRYHGVFAPASPDRAQVVPRLRAAAGSEHRKPSATNRQRAMTWAQRLKRVFAIDIAICRQCGGRLRVIASIETPAVIERILGHLGRDGESVDPAHPSRAPPTADRLV